MQRSTHITVWLWVAAGMILARYTLEFAEPAYYDATTWVDHAAVLTQTGGGIATGAALILLWRDPPVSRGSRFLALAAAGAIAKAVGNLLEDSFRIEEAVWLFFGGGMLMILSLVVAGAATLTSMSSGRAMGAFLLFAAPGGMLGLGAVMMAVAWILLGLWIGSRRPVYVFTLAGLVPVAIAAATLLYGSDVLGGA